MSIHAESTGVWSAAEFGELMAWVVRCDICREPIRQEGNVIFFQGDWFTVHKRCDRRGPWRGSDDSGWGDIEDMLKALLEAFQGEEAA